MLTLNFEGFFQCRLATDPDPADEPRGVSGWTFAVAPEPNLDRVIRFQDPVSPRLHGPAVGVTVRRVTRDDQIVPVHPLLGARVNLLDDARFEGRSGILGEDALEPIDPFLLEIAGNDVVVRREDFWSRATPRRVPIVEVAPNDLVRRRPVRGEPVSAAEVFESVGVSTPSGFLRQRQQKLAQSLPGTGDADVRAGLQKRLADLTFILDNLQRGKGDIRLSILGISVVYRFEINGPGAVISDPHGQLGGQITSSPPWPIQFWMGGFDADALCGYVRGRLQLPVLPVA